MSTIIFRGESASQLRVAYAKQENLPLNEGDEAEEDSEEQEAIAEPALASAREVTGGTHQRRGRRTIEEAVQ